MALAAAGCALAVLGAVIIGGDGLGGGGDGDGSRIPGLLLCAGVVVAGYVLLAREGAGGPLATAGTVAAVLGVPPLLFFLSFDADGFPPYSTDMILMGSTIVWALSWAAGPARSRPFFLGAAAFGLWASILQATEGLFDAPFGAVPVLGPLGGATGFGDPTIGGEFGFPGAPDPTTVGFLTLAIAAAYLVLARRWDRARLAGAATPLTFVGLLLIPNGISSLAPDLEALGTGLVTAVIGLALVLHGASVRRRGTTWFGGLAVAIGLVIIVLDTLDEATPAGTALIVVGAGVIVGAEALRRAIDEPPEGIEAATAPVEF